MVLHVFSRALVVAASDAAVRLTGNPWVTRSQVRQRLSSYGWSWRRMLRASLGAAAAPVRVRGRR